MLRHFALFAFAFAATWAVRSGWGEAGQPITVGDAKPPVCEAGRVYRLSDRLLVGPRLLARGDWDALANAGVTHTLSVDALPSPPLAESLGLTRRHVPIGYDGPDRFESQQLLAVLEECERTGGTLYVHCHHGRHRGPAAAALLGVWSHQFDADAAREAMAAIGTDAKYVGLWELLERPRPSVPEIARDVPAESAVNPLARAMAELDGAIAASDAVLIDEAIREVERVRPLDWDAAAWDRTASLLRSHADNERIVQSCAACHATMRDR